MLMPWFYNAVRFVRVMHNDLIQCVAEHDGACFDQKSGTWTGCHCRSAEGNAGTKKRDDTSLRVTLSSARRW